MQHTTTCKQISETGVAQPVSTATSACRCSRSATASLQVVGEMALLESAAAIAAAPAADAEGRSASVGTRATGRISRVDDSAGGSGWSAFRWPKRGVVVADTGIPPGTRGASVRALTAVSVAIVPAAHFHAVCAAHPEVR